MLVAVLPTLEGLIQKLEHSKAVCAIQLCSWTALLLSLCRQTYLKLPYGHACLYVLQPALPVNMYIIANTLRCRH